MKQRLRFGRKCDNRSFCNLILCQVCAQLIIKRQLFTIFLLFFTIFSFPNLPWAAALKIRLLVSYGLCNTRSFNVWLLCNDKLFLMPLGWKSHYFYNECWVRAKKKFNFILLVWFFSITLGVIELLCSLSQFTFQERVFSSWVSQAQESGFDLFQNVWYHFLFWTYWKQGEMDFCSWWQLIQSNDIIK